MILGFARRWPVKATMAFEEEYALLLPHGHSVDKGRARMNFTIRTIPGDQQRYETTGDWLFKNETLAEILITDMEHPDSEFCVAVHEAIEAWLCHKAAITMETVDAFDTAWKAHDGLEEAGDDPKAPYYKQHQFALDIERRLCGELGMTWEAHNRRVMEA